ncbi:zinc ribbon domain-containing protein [Chloroflexota bacterium]
MTVFIATVLTILTFAFITYPLLKRKPLSVDSSEDGEKQELHSKRDTAYSMLKELEFDFQSGILTEEDYRDLEARYKGKAISILKDLDNLGKPSVVEDKMEKQVQKPRRVSSTKVDKELEKEILELRRRKGRFCPQCGEKSQEDDHFCSHCGARLSARRAN